MFRSRAGTNQNFFHLRPIFLYTCAICIWLSYNNQVPCIHWYNTLFSSGSVSIRGLHLLLRGHRGHSDRSLPPHPGQHLPWLQIQVRFLLTPFFYHLSNYVLIIILLFKYCKIQILFLILVRKTDINEIMKQLKVNKNYMMGGKRK